MSKLVDEITVDYLKEFLQYGEKADKMEKTLETKGKALATEIEFLEELEGEATDAENLKALLDCPMTNVLKEIKKVNEELTGENAFPDFYKDIVDEYKKKYPDDAAILHPLCIVHQSIRKTFGKIHGQEIQQVACRAMATGDVVYSKKGLGANGISEEKAKEMLEGKACLYHVK